MPPLALSTGAPSDSMPPTTFFSRARDLFHLLCHYLSLVIALFNVQWKGKLCEEVHIRRGALGPGAHVRVLSQGPGWLEGWREKPESRGKAQREGQPSVSLEVHLRPNGIGSERKQGLSRETRERYTEGQAVQAAKCARRYMFRNSPLARSQCRVSERKSPKAPCLFVRPCKHPKCFANTSVHMLKIPAPATQTTPQCHQLPTEHGQLDQHAILNPVPTPSQDFHAMPLQSCSNV